MLSRRRPAAPARLYLAEWRARRGISQAALARAVGVRQATLSDHETGRARAIRLQLLADLATALECEPWELLRPPG